ncbi:MAG: GspE/PulE family protein [Gammaproteobacteria bacterium]|nr:GspE/PulE family protein [Gammaproteobacteria bacterium]
MNTLSDRVVKHFEAVRQALVGSGALPSNAMQLACPSTPEAIVPRLLRAGADAESVTLALSEAFSIPVYSENLHGSLEYAADGLSAWADGRLFVTDPFACQHLVRNPQLTLPREALGRHRGETGLIPIQPSTHSETAQDPSLSPEAEQILHEWITLAIDRQASDLHIVPRDNEAVEIKMRRNGLLLTLREERMVMSEKCNYRLISNTLLTLSGNQHGVYNTPKDGSLEMPLRGQVFFIRVNMCPVTIGRKVWGSFTLRIVAGYQRSVQTLDQLALGPSFVKSLHRIVAMNSGLFLLTGPTGVGKTTTFYALVMEILRRNHSQVSIKTLEDPIEVQIPGIDQIQINDDIGMSYAAGLRALLRADPDVILIGEIRDEKTAQLACRASLTGHLVLSTLHTNNSLGAIERLRNLGIHSHLIADTLAAVSAQRLVRQVCPHCATRKYDEASWEATCLLRLPPGEPWPVACPEGCEHCEHSGYRGRICIAETLFLDSRLAEHIAGGAGLTPLYDTACAQGFQSLWDHATELVRAGQTTWAECLRILPEPPGEPLQVPESHTLPLQLTFTENHAS